ncbi:hypothetical protein M501DRAFT_1029948 [Patellaria atrata CBS 101060]|uniref:Uncharacterized protein n=1 Tax=Patellaria atrata CBS 101060 TaxID=1346257 RepID=A0A9P4VUK7_9PEZI|nr:hypothetical protein M501DRAFT_1029948 [Patellaria atrata CBS 101060]
MKLLHFFTLCLIFILSFGRLVSPLSIPRGVAVYNLGCGITRISKQAWDKGINKDIIKWIGDRLKDYQKDKGASKERIIFSEYLRRRYAPDATSDMVACNGGFGCLMLGNFHDALLITHDAVDYAASYIFVQAPNMVSMFTDPKERQKKVVANHKIETKLMTAFMAIVASALMAAGQPEVGLALMALTAGAKAATIGTERAFPLRWLHRIRRSTKKLTDIVPDWLSVEFSNLGRKVHEEFTEHLGVYMCGQKDSNGNNLVDLFKTGLYLEPCANVKANNRISHEESVDRLRHQRFVSFAYAVGITHEDIVRSSLDHYRIFGNKACSAVGTKELVDKSHTNEFKNIIPGMFTVPVCRNPRGEAISSIRRNKSRNYPCMCGGFSWDSKDYKKEKDETETLLQASNLYASEDFAEYCSKSKFKKDKARPFHFKVGKTNEKPYRKSTHHYKKCKGKDHKVKD